MRHLLKHVFSTFEMVTNFLINIPIFGFGINVCLSFLAGVTRLFNGNSSPSNIDNCSRPNKMLVLYQYEGCPFCRRVREQLSSLSLDVLVYPCPRVTLGEYGVAGDSRYRPTVQKLIGTCIFPVLVDENVSETDPNAKSVIVDSMVISKHLWQTYGDKIEQPSVSIMLQNNSGLFLALPTLFRCIQSMGIMRLPSNLTKTANSEPSMPSDFQPLEFYCTEHNTLGRIVRELLDSLELPYILRNMPSNATAPAENYRKRFKCSDIIVPRLVDCNNTWLGYKAIRTTGDICSSSSSVSSAKISTPGDEQIIDLTSVYEMMVYLRVMYQRGGLVGSRWGDYSTKGATAQHGVFAGRQKEA